MGGLARLDDFSGIYTMDEVLIYFQALRKTLDDNPALAHPFALVTDCCDHCMGVSYDCEKKVWKFFEVGAMPTQKLHKDEEIAKALITGHSINHISAFAIKVYTADCYRETIEANLFRSVKNLIECY